MQTDCFPGADAGWKKAPVSSLAEQNPSYPLSKGVEYPFIEMASVAEKCGGILRVDSRQFDSSGLARFRAGDTLFAKITPCPENGKVAFVDHLPAETGLGSTEFIVLSPREGTSPRFLYHLACSHEVRGRAAARMEGSTGRQRVPDDVFQRRLLVPIPDSDEQAAIARVLDAVDTAIDNNRNARDSATATSNVLLNHLLVQSLERDSMVALGDHITDGPANGVYLPESSYEPSGTPIIRIDSFSGGRICDLDRLRRVTIADVLRERYAVMERDILLNRVNALTHVGKAAIVPKLSQATIFESNMMRLRTDADLMPEFLNLVLRSDLARKHWLACAKPAVNQVSVNQGDVKRLKLPLPNPSRQRDIVDAIAAADKLAGCFEERITALSALKKGLMHDLLTGTKRIDPALFPQLLKE